MNDTAERVEPPDQPVPAPAGTGNGSGRCHWCGYSLVGLADRGNCPECGTSYSPQSTNRLQPWPSAVKICVRLGWPIAGMMLAGFLIVNGDDPGMIWRGPLSTSEKIWNIGWIIGYAMIVAVGFNSYFQVRSMLRRSLPEGIRTRGPVAIWRAIGTTVCVIILLVFVVAPCVIFVACLINPPFG
ncbi:MAG: hypothetical protein IIA64_01660 [Planctomycetes bacterium]|nr:hypothetical protein [Planctomycetota bacterium]